MRMTRRKMLGTLAAAVPLLAAAPLAFAAESKARKRLGVCSYSYNLHWKAAREGHPQARFKDMLGFLDYCHSLGAGGVQIGVSEKERGSAAKIRSKLEEYGMYLEGQVSLPKDTADLDPFQAELQACKEAGAEVVRSAMLNGRRYETFESAEAFRQFAERSWLSLTLAEPVLKKHRLRLAIENHKDWRVSEFLDLLKRLSSEWVGVCLDTGNNIALLEEPLAVVEALASYAISSHLKDMAVQEYEEGFMLSEVSLGEGFLDLRRMIAAMRAANPKLQFTLEMITRDPLKVPCLTEKYFATMPALPAGELASGLRRIRAHASQKPLPRTSGLTMTEQLALEDDLVRKSFIYANRELAL